MIANPFETFSVSGIVKDVIQTIGGLRQTGLLFQSHLRQPRMVIEYLASRIENSCIELFGDLRLSDAATSNRKEDSNLRALHVNLSVCPETSDLPRLLMIQSQQSRPFNIRRVEIK